MFTKTYHATHPDMMYAVSNDDLRDRYLMDGLFAADDIVLHYNHAERFVVGGAAPVSKGVKFANVPPVGAAAPLVTTCVYVLSTLPAMMPPADVPTIRPLLPRLRVWTLPTVPPPWTGAFDTNTCTAAMAAEVAVHGVM